MSRSNLIVVCLVVLAAVVISGHEGPPGHNHTLPGEAHLAAPLLGTQQPEKAVLPVNPVAPVLSAQQPEKAVLPVNPAAPVLGAQQPEKAVLPINPVAPVVAGSDGKPKR